MTRWISVAAVLAKLHYNTERNLSCLSPKTSRFVLRDPHRDSGVGTSLLRITASGGDDVVSNAKWVDSGFVCGSRDNYGGGGGRSLRFETHFLVAVAAKFE